MTKEEMRKKFLDEHTNYNFERAGGIFPLKHKPRTTWRDRYKHVDYFKDVPRNLKILTRKVTRQKIKEGLIIKKSCEVCHSKDSVAHHEDYSDPMRIMWLCVYHHTKRHKVLNRVKLTRL